MDHCMELSDNIQDPRDGDNQDIKQLSQSETQSSSTLSNSEHSVGSGTQFSPPLQPPTNHNISVSLVSKVGRVLQTLALMGDQYIFQNPYSPQSQVLSAFHSTVPPGVPVQAYYVYVTMNAGLSDDQAITTLILIERMCNSASSRFGMPVIINSLTIHRLILASALVTSKFYNDVFFGNHFVAYVGGVQLPEMNLLEAEFLRLLHWHIWVEHDTEYQVYKQGVQQHFENSVPTPTIMPPPAQTVHRSTRDDVEMEGGQAEHCPQSGTQMSRGRQMVEDGSELAQK